jgi:hypothetical protein
LNPWRFGFVITALHVEATQVNLKVGNTGILVGSLIIRPGCRCEIRASCGYKLGVVRS